MSLPILLSPAYRLQVADFGLSRVVVGTHLRTAAAGTVTHMSPELLMSGHMRTSGDVYSFGILRECQGMGAASRT